MESLELVLGIVLLSLVWVQLVIRRRRMDILKLRSLPPGPTPWPVVGNIFQLGFVKVPHKSFAQLALVHDPNIMTLWLGSMCTVIISSNDAAREMFKNHDVVLAGRKVYECMKGDYGDELGSIITAQYGSNWRLLRRLSTAEFFLNSRLDATSGIRSRCIDRLVQSIQDASGNGATSIDVGRFFFLMAFNLIGNLMFSKDLLDPKSKKGAEFFYHAGKVMEYAGKPNVSDFMPFLKWLDPQGIRKNMQNHIREAFRIAGGFIAERMESSEQEKVDKKSKDYLDVLLEHRGDGVEGPFMFSSTTINIIVFEMFTAGTDTTTSTLEWAMAELLHNPHTYHKLQTELRNVVSRDEKLEERHIENLPYLKAVIKETLRLHPPLPFLVPHKAMESCTMFGYNIPKETQVLVNVWAIGRDPRTWEDASVFKPDRFLESMVDYKGQHFEFIPFGSGRRMCPAIPLVSRVLPLALGTLLHRFDWVLGDGVKADEMDMNERMGMTLRKDVPLKATPLPVP